MGKTAKNKRVKKAAFFDPYLDTLGGGERYFLTLASILAQKNWQVDLFWPDPSIAKKVSKILLIDLERVNFVNYRLDQLNLFKKLKILSKYDLLLE